MTRRTRRAADLSVAVAIALVAIACSSGGGGASPAVDASRGGPLTIYAAASLKGALAALSPAWEAAHPGSPLTISTESSAALETQIEQGAPADVFVSADTKSPAKLAGMGLTDGAAIPVARNVLALVVPRANPAAVTSPADLARPGTRIIAAGEGVPITTYAEKLAANLAALDGYGLDFPSRYAANVVSREDNVTAVVAKVALGEGDAGIVYQTDALAATGVATVPIPEAANVSADYAGVVVGASPHRAMGHAFLDWLAGPSGQGILATFGFRSPTG